jgi:hypothetical protein
LSIIIAEAMLACEIMEIISGENEQHKNSTKELGDASSSPVNPAGSPKASLDDQCNSPANDMGEISNTGPWRWMLFSCFHCAPTIIH